MPYYFAGHICEECRGNSWLRLPSFVYSFSCQGCGNVVDMSNCKLFVRKGENKEDDMPNIFKCDECGEIIRRKEKILVQLHVERPKSQDENYETIPEVSVSSFRDLCGKCYDAFVGNWPYPCRPEGDDE